ncbi:MAG: DUF454 family protein [Pseudomonadales bacterium]|nr:DUF454 family protein [Pseudomonadales bacterium]
MREPATTLALPMKVVYLVMAVVLLALGLVGLVLPILPGVLFLAAAILVLGKVSKRVRSWSHKHPGMRSMNMRMARLGKVGFVDRVKLAGWLTLDLLVKGVTGVGRLAKQSLSLLRR